MDGTAVAERLPGVHPADCSLAFGPNDDALCWWCGRALPGVRTVWCSTRCEATFRENHEWPIAREAALLDSAGRCEVCGRRGRVEVHHEQPVTRGYGPSCEHHRENLTVLCKAHHTERHTRLRAKPGTQLALFRAA